MLCEIVSWGAGWAPAALAFLRSRYKTRPIGLAASRKFAGHDMSGPYEARLRGLLVMILDVEISVQRGDTKMLLLVGGDFGFVDQRKTNVVEAL